MSQQIRKIYVLRLKVVVYILLKFGLYCSLCFYVVRRKYC